MDIVEYGATVTSEPSRLRAAVHHRGDYGGMAAAHEALREWLGVSRYRAIGPASEVYLIGPDQTVNTSDLLTEISVPITPELGLSVRLRAGFDEVLEQTRKALPQQGFQVLTEIDMRAMVRSELDVGMEPYVILGACHPVLAHRALEVERQVGLLLPCNVVVRADGDCTLVEAIDPEWLTRVTEQPALRPIAAQARELLAAALDTLMS